MGFFIVLTGFVSFCLFSELFEGAHYRTIGYLGGVTMGAFGCMLGFLLLVRDAIVNDISDGAISAYLMIIAVLCFLYEKFKDKLHG